MADGEREVGSRTRPWTVEVTHCQTRTFATEERALGAAMLDVSHMPIGTEAWIRERWLNGSLHTAYVLKRMPSHQVHVRLQWIAEAVEEAERVRRQGIAELAKENNRGD